MDSVLIVLTFCTVTLKALGIICISLNSFVFVIQNFNFCKKTESKFKFHDDPDLCLSFNITPSG